MSRPTYWNGEETPARRVRVIVADHGTFPKPWFRHLVGSERDAVEVTYDGKTFYLDDEDPPGGGWSKVTVDLGTPLRGHRSLDVDRVVGER